MRIVNIIASFFVLSFSAAFLTAAPPNRITRPLDASRTAVVPGRAPRLAQAKFDRGAVDPAKQLHDMVLLVKPSAAQQGDLDNLLLAQQNPSSASFRKWLTPQQFGGRFGLNSSDQSKVVAWLTSQGFSVGHLARSANWIVFSGTAAQVANALHTPIHQFEVNGEMHFANTMPPSVPEALADVVAGFLGLSDFHPQPNVKTATPAYSTTSGAHYLAPIDFETIYDVSPLYAAGTDGTGQSIVVVGQSDVLLSDISAFRTRYGLSANDPTMILYSTTDPGFNGSQIEGNLDLEWAGAIAPKASIYYVYGDDAFEAALFAVESDFAPVISISYSTCEIDGDPLGFRALAQQGNAEGITLLSASGDAGAAGCDQQAAEPFATLGQYVNYPAVLPEVTGIGGTQFVEGTGSYWAIKNSTTFGSAISYIPETAWNQSNTDGLGSTGGGASIFFTKPAWQSGPGVPNDNARDVPDLALNASADHDPYLITYDGQIYAVGGTSCSTPSMAGIVALLNQAQQSAGLGNINPQLYHMAQSTPSAFHDVTTGNNIVSCAQGSPDCTTGSFGYSAGSGYDPTTGLGSIDANILVTKWSTGANASVLTLSSSATTVTLNDTVQFTATVTPATGSGTPTGTVSFVFNANPLASVTLKNGSATVSIPMYEIGYPYAPAVISAEYSGDASFSSAIATEFITIATPTGVTSIVPTAPTSVFPQPADAEGLSWQTVISLTEVAGVPAIVTGLTIDGVSQTLSQYFPSTAIAPNATVNVNFVFRGLNPPVTRTFVFTGTDPTGLVWTRQVAVNYLPLPAYDYFNISLTPLVVTQNLSAPSNCQWSAQVNLDDVGGVGLHVLSTFNVGGVILSANIASTFGTTQLDAYDGLQGTLCFSGITPPATDTIDIQGGLIALSFVGSPANPGTISAAPAALNLTSSNASTTLAVNLSDKTQQWTASIYPANRTTAWLTASQLSGTGPGSITLTANGTGFEPGAYRATIVLQSQNAQPQYINVPVMFVLGGSTSGTSISSILDSASFKSQISPGMLATIYGAGLANTSISASGSPLPFSTAGVSVTVNGFAAPVVYASPTQLNIQVPYAAGAGPAVVGVNNNGQIAGFSFQISPTAPGIFADGNGNVVPTPTVSQGGEMAFYMTGAGDNSPAIATALSPVSGTPLANLPVPLQPVSVTVGGVPAFLEFVGITPGLIGVTQMNILVPSSVPTGNQPLVVTVGAVSSAPVNVVVQP
ncbi:MAG: protease pro-enzyme activation domain-containing protein [Bryobacteraceae bacterium]